MAHVIDGAAIAQQVKSDVARRVAELKKLGHRVHLTAVLVAASPAGELYARRQGEACAAVGIALLSMLLGLGGSKGTLAGGSWVTRDHTVGTPK